MTTIPPIPHRKAVFRHIRFAYNFLQKLESQKWKDYMESPPEHLGGPSGAVLYHEHTRIARFRRYATDLRKMIYFPKDETFPSIIEEHAEGVAGFISAYDPRILVEQITSYVNDPRKAKSIKHFSRHYTIALGILTRWAARCADQLAQADAQSSA